jgi:hypothetical protein
LVDEGKQALATLICGLSTFGCKACIFTITEARLLNVSQRSALEESSGNWNIRRRHSIELERLILIIRHNMSTEGYERDPRATVVRLKERGQMFPHVQRGQYRFVRQASTTMPRYIVSSTRHLYFMCHSLPPEMTTSQLSCLC